MKTILTVVQEKESELLQLLFGFSHSIVGIVFNYFLGICKYFLFTLIDLFQS